MLLRGDIGEPVRIVTPMVRERVLGEMSRSFNLSAMLTQVSLVAEPGDPQTVFIEQAVSRIADLIVMGTHGLRGFKRLLLGSVAEAVLREAPCPVLTVPPHAPAAVSDAATFTHVLCPIDFSSSAVQALDVALDLTRQAGGEVTLLHVVEWPPVEEGPWVSQYFDGAAYSRDMAAEADERVRSLVANESRTWAQIGRVVVFGRAYCEILPAAETKHAELIVMGAPGRGGVDLALFGSTTQHVVRGAACPVLTVRAQHHMQGRLESLRAASVA